MTLDRDQALTVLKKFGKAFNAGDITAILDCVTDDFEWVFSEGPEAPFGRVVRGREAVAAALAERASEFSAMRFSETEVLYADDRVIGVFRCTATKAGGEKIDARGVDIYTFRDGRIARKDSYLKQVRPAG